MKIKPGGQIYELLLLLVLNLLLPKASLAQLAEGDTVNWRLTSNLSLKLNRGNVERFIAMPEMEMMHLSKARLFGFSLRERYTYGTFGKFTTERDLLSRNIVYLFPHRVIYPYILSWFQTHELQRLQFRYQVGPGVTLALVARKNAVIRFSVTGTYEKNIYTIGKLTLLESGESRYHVFRATARILGSHIFSDAVSFNYEYFLQQALDDKENWRMFLETSFSVKINGGFSLRPILTYEYQTVYVEGRKPQDIVFNLGLNYRRQILHH